MQQKLFQVRRKHWSALLILITATIIVTWPIAGELGSRIPGSEGDVWEHLWIFEWVKQSLFQGGDLFYTNLIFHPQGTSLATHNFAWFNIALWLPLQAMIGSGAAYSLMMLVVFVLNGFAAYLFVFELTKRFSAAMIGGVIAAFWPHILSHNDHPNLIVTAWVTLTLLALKRLIENEDRRYALLGGLFLALVGLTRWQTLVLGGGLIGLYLLYLLLVNRTRANLKDRVLNLSLMMGVALLLMLPLFLAQFSQAAGLGETITGVADGNAGQSDLLAYFLPSRFHPWWGTAVFEQFYGPLQTSKVFTPFLGYTVLVLVIIGVVWGWMRTRFWAGCGVLYVLLALGPTLLANGRSFFPLPYRLLESTFLDALIRSPDRFNVFLSLPVAVMAGYGLSAFRERLGVKRPISYVFPVLAFLLIGFEFAVHYPTLALNDFPNWYYTLAQEAGSFGILELPMSDRSYDEVYMHYQSLHEKPIVGGSIARISEETFGFIQSLPMLGGIPESQVPPEGVVNVGSQLTTLAEADVKYLIFHKKFMGADQLQGWRDWLLVPAFYEDEQVLVYRTDWVVGQSLPFTSLLEDGLGIISADLEPTSTTQDGWVEVTVQWGATGALSENYDVCLLLENGEREVVSESCFPISKTVPSGGWPANEMVSETYLLHMSPYLASDNYTLRARVDDEGGESGALVLGMVDFSARPRVFVDTADAEILANWDNKIGLVSYMVNQASADTLDIQVEWLAQQRMEQSYKFFVHVIDSATRELVGQVDTVPVDWSYPTNWWEQGEVISDNLHLTLPAGLSGEYEVRLGFYSLGTNDPLPVTDGFGGFTAEGNQILLSRVVIDD